MKLKRFQARNIPILNLSHRVDADGDIFPPELHATFNNPVPVIYDYDYGKKIGKAYLMRVQDTIVADIYVLSGVEDEDESKALIQRMYPAISARLHERVGQAVFNIEITAVSLSFNANADAFIQPLGRKVVRERKPVK